LRVRRLMSMLMVGIDRDVSVLGAVLRTSCSVGVELLVLPLGLGVGLHYCEGWPWSCVVLSCGSWWWWFSVPRTIGGRGGERCVCECCLFQLS
jgi:hypothetical protein